MNGRCYCYISKVPAKDNSSKLMLKEMSHLTEMGVGLMWMDHFQRKEEGFSWKYGSKGWKEGKQWVQARSRDRRAQEGDSWLEDYSLSPSDGWRIVPFLFWWLEDCPLSLLIGLCTSFTSTSATVFFHLLSSKQYKPEVAPERSRNSFRFRKESVDLESSAPCSHPFLVQAKTLSLFLIF